MSYYRYTNKDGDGIYRDYPPSSHKLEIASRWLPVPPVYEDERIKPQAWFTEKGDAKFVATVLPIFLESGVEVTMEARDALMGKPVYADEYQVIIALEK